MIMQYCISLASTYLTHTVLYFMHMQRGTHTQESGLGTASNNSKLTVINLSSLHKSQKEDTAHPEHRYIIGHTDHVLENCFPNAFLKPGVF